MATLIMDAMRLLEHRVQNIGDEEPSPVGIDGDEPVEISCDGGHGTISRADPHTAEFGNVAGENRSLYFAGDGEFIFD